MGGRHGDGMARAVVVVHVRSEGRAEACGNVGRSRSVVGGGGERIAIGRGACAKEDECMRMGRAARD
jgi:hypothetical protein